MASLREQKFIDEYAYLLESMCRHVYELDTEKLGKEEVEAVAENAWEHTALSPLDLIEYHNSPHYITNQVSNQTLQKAREGRWKVWLLAQWDEVEHNARYRQLLLSRKSMQEKET